MREGARVREEVLGRTYVQNGKKVGTPFYQNFIDFTTEHCWGNVWLRDGLERSTRSLLNLAMLSVMGRWYEFEVHMRGALNNGVAEEQIAEVLLQAGVYGGVPVAAEGFRRAQSVIDAVKAESASTK